MQPFTTPLRIGAMANPSRKLAPSAGHPIKGKSVSRGNGFVVIKCTVQVQEFAHVEFSAIAQPLASPAVDAHHRPRIAVAAQSHPTTCRAHPRAAQRNERARFPHMEAGVDHVERAVMRPCRN
jgi:hypothetical protein